MSRRTFLAAAAGGLVAAGCQGVPATGTAHPEEGSMRVALPPPDTTGGLALAAVLAARRSVRELGGNPPGPAELSQLLWATQGVSDPDGLRTVPSAGALYPLEVYAVAADGVCRYVPGEHALEPLAEVDVRPRLMAAALGQRAVGDAPLVVVITVVPARTEARYGSERARRYVDLEAGHAAQNLLLAAVALELASVPIGAFDDAAVAEVLGLPAGEEPRYLIPVGRAR